MKDLKIKDIAAELQVSQATVYRYIHTGEMQHIDVGTDKRPRLRVTQKDFDAWKESRKSRPGKSA